MLFVPQMSEFLSWGKQDRMDNFASARNRELQRNTHMVAGKSRDALVTRKRAVPSFTTVARMM